MAEEEGTSDGTPMKRARIVLRACDNCKSSKRKCSGDLPCSYCVAGRRTCAYNVADKRRKRPLSPLHSQHSESESSVAPLPPAHHEPAPPPIASTSSQPLAPSDTASPSVADDDTTLSLLAKVMAHEQLTPSADAGPEQRGTHSSFIERIHRHLTVTFSLRSFPRGHNAESEDAAEAAFSFANFLLPAREDATAYVKCYFEHASATYRFLDRNWLESLVERFYNGDSTVTGSSDDCCLILLVMAAGCLWTPSWTGTDPDQKTAQAINIYLAAKRRLAKTALFPPRLITVQTYLVMVQVQLGLTRFQSAFLTLGQAARLAQLLGLHRGTAELLPTPADELRRRVFWCSFLLDRYLALVLGVPVLYDERDITQLYPTVPELGHLGTGGLDGSQEATLIGSLAHIKLSRIMGHALRRLHSGRDIPPTERDQAVRELSAEIELWHQTTPAFFQPFTTPEATKMSNPFVQIPPFFQRQQRTVHNAYHFLKLFIYRGYLLDSFLSHLPGTAPLPFHDADEITPEVRECVSAAIAIAQMASSMQNNPNVGGTFWNAAYFSFAALIVLNVYSMIYRNAPDRQDIELVIDAAMKGHQRLTGSTEAERNEILQESRRIGAVIKERAATGGAQPLDFNSYMYNIDSPGGVDANGNPTNWDAIWAGMQELVTAGFDATTLGFDFQADSSGGMFGNGFS